MSWTEFIRPENAFVLYRVPHEPVEFMGCKGPAQTHKFNEALPNNGFIAAPFKYDGANPAHLIIPEHYQSLELDEIGNDVDLPLQRSHGIHSTSKQDYLSQCNRFIEHIQTSELDKAILSRVETTPRGGINPIALFKTLCASWPNAFVYLLHLPEHGTWAAATPENLVAIDSSSLRTMALAGTQQLTHQDLRMYSWGEKERVEQGMVAKYIEELLDAHNLDDYRKVGPLTTIAGNVVHLLTNYTAYLHENSDFSAFVRELHPTPAVCGLPKAQALELIAREEQHDRQLYAGFLGPVSEQETQLFVNLRCMQLFDDAFALYLGGGITADSVPDLEWRETNLKARTLLSVIEKMRNFAS